VEGRGVVLQGGNAINTQKGGNAWPEKLNSSTAKWRQQSRPNERKYALAQVKIWKTNTVWEKEGLGKVEKKRSCAVQGRSQEGDTLGQTQGKRGRGGEDSFLKFQKKPKGGGRGRESLAVELLNGRA